MSKILAIMILLAAAGHARPAVFTYECTVLPIPAGWELLSTFCYPEEWITDGWLIQHMEPECQPEGDQVIYGRGLGDFVGDPEFFVQWRMHTDGSSDEFLAVAPAVLVAAGGGTGVNYHFTIARDLVRFIRDSSLPIIFVEIDPDVPHTYRLEVYWDQLYVWYIDGQVVDSGVPEGPFPTWSGAIIGFGAKSWLLESTTMWDYIRYGKIPTEGTGDFNNSGTVELDDFYFFHECLSNSGPGADAGPGCRWADMDQDSDVDFHDLGLFQLAFTGSG